MEPSDAISIHMPAVALCRKATTTAAKAKQTVIPTKIPPLGTIRSIAKITSAAINNKTAIASKDIDENFQKNNLAGRWKKGGQGTQYANWHNEFFLREIFSHFKSTQQKQGSKTTRQCESIHDAWIPRDPIDQRAPVLMLHSSKSRLLTRWLAKLVLFRKFFLIFWSIHGIS